ncbi:hypothetical protein D9758_011846 [Tetrapyrgos nigripes]|uniref:Uncharacterized protein n=1 Tax=Tetrapyrgos nigripes TaxID=182062 RepID=A0A8H5CKK1_9AGAR|nr:hypothetical protein D9758_011846 [Tetrapyrgos nigripes]
MSTTSAETTQEFGRDVGKTGGLEIVIWRFKLSWGLGMFSVPPSFTTLSSAFLSSRSSSV